MSRNPSVIKASETPVEKPIAFEAALVGEISAADGDADAPKKFTMTAYNGGPMSVGFGEDVIVDLSGVTTHADATPILRDHDRSRVLGHSEAIEVSARAIKVRGVLSGSNDHVREVVGSAKQGFPWRASIGARPTQMEFIRAGVSVRVNGSTFKGPVYVARKAVLTEVSIVAIPADSKTNTKVAASAQPEEQIMNFEAWLKSKNLIMADLSETRLEALRAEYDAGVEDGSIKAAADPDPEPAPAPKPKRSASPAPSGGRDIQAEIAAEREIRAAEDERIAAINAAAPDHAHAAIRAQAIRENWDGPRTEQAVELATLRASREQNPGGSGGNRNGAPAGDVLECAMMQSLGFGAVEEHYDEQTLEAAHKAYHSSIGLQEAIMISASANGYRGPSGPSALRADLGGVLRAAMPAHPGGDIEASFSTLSLPGILSNIANKFLLDSFNRVEQVWREIAAIRNVRDFKQTTSYRLGSDMVYEQIGPDGELKHGGLTEQSYTNQALTYGKMFSITRTNIINDDMGAFRDVPTMIGRGGGLKLNLVFWAAFLNNSAFWTAGNGSYIDGAATAFGISGLTLLEKLFLDQTDPDGNPVSIDPAILLVPTAHKTEAELIMSSPEMRDTTTSKRSATRNPHAGKWKALCSRYLSNSTLTGYSSTAHYLLADPRDMPVIEVAFLNGKQEPTVETAEADFNTLGIQMRGYHDFGVSLQEYRGGAKSKGTA